MSGIEQTQGPCYSDRVRFSELDPQGVVFYSRYFEYADAAIMEYFRLRGISDDDGTLTGFQVRKSVAEYFQPLGRDDEFEASVRVKALGTSSVAFEVVINDRGSRQKCCCMELLYVYVDIASVKSVRVPDRLRGKLLSN